MERWQQSLDSYITSGRYIKWNEELQCKECGFKWNARFEEEYGMTSYIDDDNLCPECGADDMQNVGEVNDLQRGRSE